MRSPALSLVFGSIARIACEEFTRNTTPRLIMDRDGDSVYLERYYVLGGPSEDREWSESPIGVYLHRFRRGDDDEELHNHPWNAVSFILAGGYSEERRMANDSVERRTLRPFSFNVILANDFHRVDLLEADCWSIFFVGPKLQSWGFWNRLTRVFTPWREFIAKKRGIDPATVSKNVVKSEDLK